MSEYHTSNLHLDECDGDNNNFADSDEDQNKDRNFSTPRRRNSDPGMPSSGPVRSSPIVGTAQQKKDHRFQKAQRQRQRAFQRKREEKMMEEQDTRRVTPEYSC